MNDWPSDWSPRIAVTGASGFVGSHLVQRLQRDGLGVVALSRRPLLDVESVMVRDYLDTAELREAFTGVSAVVHLAARAHQNDGDDATHAYHEANVQSTLSVTHACVAAGVRRLVFVSSIGVNGNHSAHGPFTEADVPQPVEPYAKSKLEAERALAARLAHGATDFVIIRPPLVYGPGCPGNFRQLLRLATRAPIVPLGAVTAPRRFVYVGNLVDALRVAAWHPAASRRTFLVADGRDVSVAEVVRTAAAAIGRSPARIWNVPPQLLALAARLAGRSGAFNKLAAALQIDAAAFSAATGWTPPFDPSEGLVVTARSDFQVVG